MSMLDLALQCAARGWYVFPCRGKIPIHEGGYKNAAVDADTIQRLWASNPNANPAIVPGASGFTALDIDHGLGDEESLRAFMQARGLPPTFAVRTGKRPEFRVQLYYSGCAGESLNGWKDGEFGGDLRVTWGHVMAPGAIHPESGEAYTILWDLPLAPVPAWVRGLRSSIKERVKDDGGPITENRNSTLTSIAGKLRNAGLGHDALEAALLATNAERCAPPLEEDEVRRIADNASKWPLPDGAQATLGKPADWRARYMTAEQYLNVKPPRFLIDRFLVKGSIAMLGGPVAQRKSIIALNIAHALCTGDPLFGYFGVTEKPDRTVYLCPEMGAASFVKRIKQIGLGAFVGKTLFIQTMNEHATALDELDGELPGAVVIVDTITRFLDGDESKSDDMRKFAQKVFRLVNAGATVVLLHHSKKGSTGTLDDGLRGSSELAAFVDSCWLTELEDTKRPYESLSKMRNVKQRDFESDPFRLKPSPGSYYLAMEGDPEPEATLSAKNEAAARDALAAILQEHPKLGINKLREALKAKGYSKGNAWVGGRLKEMRGGAVLSSV